MTGMPVREAAPVTSGSGDPVGQQPEGVQRLLDRYDAAGIHRLLDRYHGAGIRHTTADFHRGGRHEKLNETKGAEVREHCWPGSQQRSLGRLSTRTNSGDPNGKR